MRERAISMKNAIQKQKEEKLSNLRRLLSKGKISQKEYEQKINL